MSLINDALKRAKAAQQHAPPPPPSPLQFRPVEAGQRTKPRFDWVAPAIVAIIGIFALLFMWPRAHNSTSNAPLETKARTLVAAKESPAAPAVARASQPDAPQPTQEKQTTPPSEPAPAVVVNPAPVHEPPVPQPPPLRLQAIIYSPTRPSAMINGRALFIGEKVGDLRVTAITQETVTLTGAGQTNVLTLIP
jgi:hypothetical protein